MSSPVPQSAPSGTQVQPGSPRPCPGASVVPHRLARGRLESSFSVEAILAKPKTRELAATSLPLSNCTSLNLLGLVSQYGVLPWVCSTGSWLPPYLSVGVYPLCSTSCVPGLNVTHHLCQQGLRLTGSELPYCLGPLKWAPTVDLRDHGTERHPKRVRTMFNWRQLQELEKVFAKQHNLVGKERAQLAARLHLTENQVRIWFQNRRVKYQKQQKLKFPSSSVTEEPSSSSDGNIQSEDAESGVGS
ncbi:homeobox protein notochord [Mus pahari]|uniref:homeobox protein notochord n=1 Tax=Mus pahari TaxID=10093 RepID=UPI000A305FC0|nr:homeobox protein notochord [Mus pahari]